jgi:hypothetical protein
MRFPCHCTALVAPGKISRDRACRHWFGGVFFSSATVEHPPGPSTDKSWALQRRLNPENRTLTPVLKQYQEAQDQPLPLPEGCRPQVPSQPPSRSARHHEGAGTFTTAIDTHPSTNTNTNPLNRRSARRASGRSHKRGETQNVEGLGEHNVAMKTRTTVVRRVRRGLVIPLRDVSGVV